MRTPEKAENEKNIIMNLQRIHVQLTEMFAFAR